MKKKMKKKMMIYIKLTWRKLRSLFRNCQIPIIIIFLLLPFVFFFFFFFFLIWFFFIFFFNSHKDTSIPDDATLRLRPAEKSDRLPGGGGGRTIPKNRGHHQQHQDLSQFTVAELKQQIAELDRKMAAEIQQIKDYYAKLRR